MRMPLPPPAEHAKNPGKRDVYVCASSGPDQNVHAVFMEGADGVLSAHARGSDGPQG